MRVTFHMHLNIRTHLRIFNEFFANNCRKVCENIGQKSAPFCFQVVNGQFTEVLGLVIVFVVMNMSGGRKDAPAFATASFSGLERRITITELLFF